MGYETKYKLEVTKINKNEAEIKPVTEEDLKQSILNNVDKDIILKQLEALKNPIKEINSSLIIKQLRKENEEAAFALNKKGKNENEATWYEAKEDIKEFSKKYPDWLFTLSGEGTDNDDIWIAYSVNGKQQIETAKIVIDPFDPEKLK